MVAEHAEMARLQSVNQLQIAQLSAQMEMMKVWCNTFRLTDSLALVLWH